MVGRVSKVAQNALQSVPMALCGSLGGDRETIHDEVDVRTGRVCGVAQVTNYLLVLFGLLVQGFVLGDGAVQSNAVLVRGWFAVCDVHLAFAEDGRYRSGLNDVAGAVA